MFYYCIKLLGRCSLLFFFRRKIKCGFPLHTLKGPAIIAANHPDSMVDAVIIACLCRQPVYFTIRSDMFRNPVFRFFLKFLHGIPVFRSSEEKGKLKENFNSIARCRDILKKNGIILVFPEGITVHEWKLKPIRSAAARIVQEALTDPQLAQTLQVVPVGLTYNDYAHPAKTVLIHTGEIFYPGRLIPGEHNGAWKQTFNTLLLERLQPLIPEMKNEATPAKLTWQAVLTNITVRDNCNSSMVQLQLQGNRLSEMTMEPVLAKKITSPFFLPLSSSNAIHYLVLLLSGIPALAGLFLNSLYYFPVSRFARRKTENTIFYDSLLMGLLTITYPVYLLMLSVLLADNTGISWVIWMIIIPCCGWCTLQCWIHLLKIKHALRLTPRERKYIEDLITGRSFNNKKHPDAD